MKLVFSRKGFDSTAGGVPSPIIDNRPRSLPIPTRMPTPTHYCDLAGGISDIVSDLTRARITPDHPCHLDPDLDPNALTRIPGWRGALGQVSAAQSHLANQKIVPGDLFLFWGLFRQASRDGNGCRWHYTGPPEHRIFGWLQIDEVLAMGEDPQPGLARHPWLVAHPHASPGWPPNNTIYVARKELALPGIRSGTRGFGLFRNGIRLTSPDSKQPSTWIVPPWLNPLNSGVGMTYHPLSRWSADNKLRVAARGQEFVCDIGGRAEAFEWLKQIFESGG